MFDFDPDDYDGGREDARYERGDTHRYRYDCGDGFCGASDCGSCQPEAGDRVTIHNVADLPVGTVVGWRMLGDEWIAIKRADDEWHVPGSSLPVPYADAGVVHGEPTFILSIPAEVSCGE